MCDKYNGDPFNALEHHLCRAQVRYRRWSGTCDACWWTRTRSWTRRSCAMHVSSTSRACFLCCCCARPLSPRPLRSRSRRSRRRPVWKDGSTAATALLVNDVAFVANLGDTRVRPQPSSPTLSNPLHCSCS